MTKARKINRGFTLIETLIAISILVMAVTGAFAAAQNGISSATFSKDQIVAFYLAEEGIEEIRNLRDQNGLAGVGWLAGIASSGSDPCYFGSVCMVDAVSSTDVISKCGLEAGSCPVLKQDPDTGFFGYDSDWDNSPFRREVQIAEVTPGNTHEVTIIVTVTWSKGLLQRQFRAKENIFDWQ
ncbi:prepilin-type N-terminal cleavage/methylation domain-containing protein [Candidatus Parcubacteria bacterium]|nr:prepilin-type N-terminal cleavage/methylation domain-containing protein [Candidatus Parcubacteria bacterium]